MKMQENGKTEIGSIHTQDSRVRKLFSLGNRRRPNDTEMKMRVEQHFSGLGWVQEIP